MAVAVKHKRSKTKPIVELDENIPEVPKLEDFKALDVPGEIVEQCNEEFSNPGTLVAVETGYTSEILEDPQVLDSENTSSADNKPLSVSLALSSNDDKEWHEEEMPVAASAPCLRPMGESSIPISYSRLIDEVHACLEEISAPTAPILKAEIASVEPSISVEEHLPAYNQRTHVEMKNILEVLDIKKETEMAVQPFTEEELREFYDNHEMGQLPGFLENFLTRIEPPPSELFSLLTDYVQFCRSVEENKNILRGLMREIEEKGEGLWTVWPDIMLTERGKCADKKELIFYHSYQGARLNLDSLEAFQVLLTRIRTFVNDEKIVTELNLRVCELRIEGILTDIAQSCSLFENLQNSSPINLQMPPSDGYIQECTSRLHTATEVLFHFCRKISGSSYNEDLIDQIRKWLSSMVAILVRIGTWRDHVFIFNHVLRCPDRVSVWAARFVQCPADADHALTLLQVLLMPVNRRDAFLRDSQNEDPWVVIDSDGEDADCQSECLNEATLITMFNQIPLAEIIRKFTKDKPSEFSVLELLAFLTVVLKVLQNGVIQYNKQEYKQFIKRLGKLCKQLMVLATKQLEIFAVVSEVSPRLQAEYDSFFTKASLCLLLAEANWQFLTVVPVQLLSEPAKWRLFLSLQLSETVSLEDFGQRFMNLNEAEQIYLLSSMCNLVLCSNSVPIKLVQCVALQIFYVGFISESTRDSSYKCAKSLLSSLCLKYIFLISELLNAQEKYYENGDAEDQSLTIGLWLDLPVAKWCPNASEFDLLGRWLMNSPTSSRNEVARFILKMIDYKLVSWEQQKQIAFVLMTAYAQHNGNSAFAQWTWVCLAQLRLHLADRFSSLLDIEGSLALVPDLASNSDLTFRVGQQECIGVFVALSTTLLGHSAPLIFYQGFSLLKVLTNAKQYEAVLLCLKNMTTLFWRNPASLCTCEPFLSILGEIINADNGYTKLPKSLMIFNEGPGPVLRKFSSMLHNQLRYAEPSSLSNAVSLWMGSLCRLPLWQYNAGVLYLMDIVCRHAFFDAKAWQSVADILEGALTSLSTPQPRSPLSSIINWMGSGSENSLLAQGCNGDAPWFAYAALSVEFDVFERRTTIWNCLLQESYDKLQKKSSISGCLKKVCNTLQLPQRNICNLAIYRWASQILATSINHPLCPLLWQKFMELYFARVPGVADRGSIGAALFLGNNYSSVVKSLQVRLEEAKKSQSHFFTSMSYWLSEPTLLEPRLLVTSLPVHYQPPLLNAIFCGDTSPWLQFFDSERFLADLGKDADTWFALLARNKVTIPPLPQAKPPPPFSQLLTAIKEIQAVAQPPPELNRNWSPPVKIAVTNGVPKCPFSLNDIRKQASLLNQRDLNATKAQERLLSCVSSLYACTKCSVSLSSNCDGYKDKDGDLRLCSGPASLMFKFEEWKLDENVSRYKKEASDQFCEFVTQEYYTEVHVLVYAVRMMVFCFLRNIKEQKLLKKDTEPKTDAAVKFFFDLLQHCADDVHACPSLRLQLTDALLELGKSCVAGNAVNTSRFYDETFNNRFAFDLRNELFTPSVLDPATFVKTYRMAVMSAKSPQDESVLRNFNIDIWLQQQAPRLLFRSELLNHLFNGLKRFPDAEDSPYSQILNHNLQCLVLHDFPQHYGEVLQHLISVGQARPWLTFIVALSPLSVKFPYNAGKLNLKNVSFFINKFAIEQKHLTTKDIQETSLWGPLTLKERCLYSKFSKCAELMIIFVGIMVQSFVIQLLRTSPGALSSHLVEQVWHVLDRFFIPWLTPLKAEDTIVQPFGPDDEYLASFCLTIFTESIRFIGDSLSGTEAVLSQSWKWYTSNFCQKEISLFVVNAVHDNLATLPWLKFHPSLQDVEIMLKVVNDYLPICHSFVGNVFVSIDWNEVVNRCRSNDRLETNSQLLACLLHLLVKVPSEPSLKMNRAVQLHLSNAMSYPWYLVDSTNYQSVLAWLSSTCPPGVVLDDPGSDYRDVDTLVLTLLRTAAGFHSSVQFFHPTTPLKRQLYVTTVVKCLATEHSRRKKGLAPYLIKRVVDNILNDIEAVIVATVPEDRRLYDASLLLDAVLKLLTESSMCTVVRDSIVSFVRAGQTPLVLQGLLRTSGIRVPNPIIYGDIIECCIDTHFAFGGNRDWGDLALSIAPHTAVSSNIDSILISNSFLLTLHGSILQRLTTETDSPRTQLNTLLHMFATFKPSEESEPKLVLLIGLTLRLAQAQPDVGTLLQSLSESLNNIANDRSGGILSTLGLKRNSSPTFRLKATCLVACAGISSLLVSKFNHPSDDRFFTAMDKVDTNKAFQPILAHILAVRPALRDIKDVEEFIVLLYSLAAQVFGRLYLF